MSEGSTAKGVLNFRSNISSLENVTLKELKAEDVINIDLSTFNILVFTGGSGSKQAESLGVAGRQKVKDYVSNGGNYLGICAGAYLATTGFDWSLSLINLETVSQTEWKRGKGLVDIKITKSGEKLFPSFKKNFKVKYANGPILKKSKDNTLEEYVVIAEYESEISENGVAQGVMLNTPAFLTSKYGKGRVFIIGPHPEDTIGLERILLEVINYLLAD